MRKIFHRIWLGDEPMPNLYRQWGKALERLNPGWKVVTWSDEHIDPFGKGRTPRFKMLNRGLYDSTDDLREKADILRLELLYAYGGVYVDCDVEPLRPIEELAWVGAFVGREDHTYICNAVIGAEERSPFIKLAIDELASRCRVYPTEPLNWRTGPMMLTDVAHVAWQEGMDLKIFEPWVFYPYHHTQLEKRGEDYGVAIMVHHWASARGGLIHS